MKAKTVKCKIYGFKKKVELNKRLLRAVNSAKYATNGRTIERWRHRLRGNEHIEMDIDTTASRVWELTDVELAGIKKPWDEIM